MREVIFKNRISKEARKREVCIEETICENGCVAKTIKKSLYFVRSIYKINSQDDFNEWVNTKNKSQEPAKKRFNIVKVHSDKDNTDIVFCKAKGSFYVVVGKDIYNLVFFHSLRMEVGGPKSA